ncbi:MAG: mechanosensitive ion channel family protein [Polyangiales bacterium]
MLALSWLGSGLVGQATAQSAEHPLEPPVTSSPRETFHTFLSSEEAMWALVRDEGSGERSDEGFRMLVDFDARAKRTLDLSLVAPEAKKKTADEAAVYLYEVLTRIALPPLDEIPGDDEIERNPELERWTLPHTEITVHRVSEGAREGAFLFHPETVERAKEFYERTKRLPYRRDPPIENVAGFLEVYGGWGIPVAWIDALPAKMLQVVWGQAAWKWVVLVGVTLAFLALVFVVHRLTRGLRRPLSALSQLSKLAVPAVLLVASVWAIPRLSEEILLVGGVAKYVNLTATAIAYLSLAWMVWIVILASGEALISSPRVRTESLDASLIRLTARLIAIGAAAVLVFKGATAVGIPLVGLVASVSIGGLAVALAAQDTLKNLLGSLMIFIDQPYRVGERIIAGSHDGVVEDIGLRSTRIRQLDGALTSIPNEKMATMEIENIERREFIRRKTKLRIATGTAREEVERALAIVREILEDHEGMSQDRPPRVYFEEFNPDSLSIVLFYWYAPPDYWAFCALGERINLEIVRRFAEAGIKLAPPTSTTRFTTETDEQLELTPK